MCKRANTSRPSGDRNVPARGFAIPLPDIISRNSRSARLVPKLRPHLKHTIFINLQPPQPPVKPSSRLICARTVFFLHTQKLWNRGYRLRFHTFDLIDHLRRDAHFDSIGASPKESPGTPLSGTPTYNNKPQRATLITKKIPIESADPLHSRGSHNTYSQNSNAFHNPTWRSPTHAHPSAPKSAQAAPGPGVNRGVN